MIDIRVDFETYSEADLKAVGPWAYSLHPSTKVLMMAWAVDDSDPQIWLPWQPIPGPIMDWLLGRVEGHEEHPCIRLHAWNDFFEYCIMANVLHWKPLPDPEFWEDTAARAAALTLPRALGDCGAALGLLEDKAKDKAGKALIQMFCKPRKVKGELRRTMPADKPEEFEEFKRYCIQDVIAEREISKKLRPLQEQTRKLWELDRRINLRGVFFDIDSVKNAIEIREKAKVKELEKVNKITEGKLLNISSRPQFLHFVQCKGVTLENAQKEYLKTFVEENPDIPVVTELIKCRLRISKSSLAKYDKLVAILQNSPRAHGLLRFHGAATGRWSGNLFQPQNLPRPSFEDTDTCIELLKHKDPDLLEMVYGDPLQALSDCLRGMVIASPGNRLVVSDFSQIESRTLKWLAGDPVGLDTYRQGRDIYKVNAAAAFKTTYDKVTKDQRLIGKVIELACGYQGAVGAFQQFAVVYGVTIPDEEAKTLVKAWRLANPKIVSYWYNVEATAIKAVEDPGSTHKIGNVQYRVMGTGRSRFLYCKLPSGRLIAYHRPELIEGKFDKFQIKYWGVDSIIHKYCTQHIYGGKFVDHITQGTACDIMSHKISLLEEAGYPIILSVHDELVSDVPKGHGSLEDFNKIICTNPPWAEGLPIAAEGYEAERYRK